MAASFVGLPISCRLRTGATLQGTVTSLDAQQGTIDLCDASVTYPGAAQQAGSRFLGNWTVKRDEIVQLEVVSVPGATTVTSPSVVQHSEPTRQQVNTSARSITSVESEKVTPVASTGGRFNADSSVTSSPTHTATKTRAKLSKGKQKQKQAMFVQDHVETYTSDELPAEKTPRKRKSGQFCFNHFIFILVPCSSCPIRLEGRGQKSSANANASGFEQEFDFGAGLRSFDKQAVFDQIRSEDQTDPASRLVSHNKRHGHNPYMSKLAPNESVLSERELYDQQEDNAQALSKLSLKHLMPESSTEGSEFDAETDDDAVTASEDFEGQTSSAAVTESDSDFDAIQDRPPYLSSRRSTIKPGQDYLTTDEGRSKVTFKTDEDVACSPIPLRQYREALSIADIETGPTQVQRSEMAGLGIALFVMRHLSLDVGQSPEVCILCGEGEKAETALRAGVMLLNRGSRVTALVHRANVAVTAEFREGLRVFSSAGGRIVRDLADVSKSTSLIIDAIAPCTTATSAIPQSSTAIDSNLLSYLSSAAAPPVLSIDSPAGTDHDTGLDLEGNVSQPGQFARSINPKYIVCRGALRQGVALRLSEQRQPSGQSGKPKLQQVVLVDLGISPLVWKRLSVEYKVATFGSECVKGVF
ncbi:enhancer of mRNA decapping [Microbotryomycetes sp. JL221]|nr:enhancer of mRNA decapping [Microbotryomycetes sp. JL221]